MADRYSRVLESGLGVVMKTPLQDELERIGWSVINRSGNYRKATYVHESFPGVYLSVWLDQQDRFEAEISAIVGLMEIKVGPFSQAHNHKSFKLWIEQIFETKIAAEAILARKMAIRRGVEHPILETALFKDETLDPINLDEEL